MPFVATSVLEARRAAAARRATVDTSPSPSANLAPREQFLPAAASTEAKSRRRGHAVKDANGKWLPTGDGVGWCNPPEATRFEKGGKGGPGRPKGSVSHDTMLKKHLSQKRSVRVDGKEKKIAIRELVLMTTVKAAAEGKDRDARKYILQELARIYAAGHESGASAPAELTAADVLSLAEYEADLRRQGREELMRELSAGNGEEE